MENQSIYSTSIGISIYLCANNPWRWSGNIENNIKKATEEDFFQMFKAICAIYHQGLNRDEKSFQWYFEEIFEKKIINPKIEVEKYGPRGEGIADWFIEERKKTLNQNMDDYNKIYSLWKKVGREKLFNVSIYPDALDEIFE